MSDDYADRLGGAAAGADEGQPSAVMRLSLRAHSDEAARAFWSAIEKRFAKKRIALARAPAQSADASVFLIDADDFASEDAARALVAEASAGPAPRLLLEPCAAPEGEILARMTQTLEKLAACDGVSIIAGKRKPQSAERSQEVLKSQAKAVAKALMREAGDSAASAPADIESSREAKRQAEVSKSAKQARNPAAPADPTAPPKTDKAARKAAKKAGKQERKTEKGAKKSKRKAAKATDVPAAVAVAPEASSKPDKAARKAAKKAGKQERKSEKGAKKSERKAAKAKDAPAAAVAVAPEASSKPDKAARKAAKKAGKQERKSEKGAKKAERKSLKPGADAADAQSALTLAMVGFAEPWAGALREAVAQQAAAAGLVIEAADTAAKFDIALHGFDGAAAADVAERAVEIAKDKARVQILVSPGAQAPADHLAIEVDRAVAALAAQCGGVALRLWRMFERHLAAERQAQAKIAAQAILDIAAAHLPKRGIAPAEGELPPDLAAMLALAAEPSEFLAQLSWSKAIPPRLLRAPIDKEAMEAFVARRVALDDDVHLDIVPPIAWPAEFESRGAERRALSLDFLIPPLSYWYSKANGRDMERIAEIDAVLKERGVTASDILAQAGAVILDFAGTHPRAGDSPAWSEDAIAGRCRAMAFFVLCCKMALKRRIKFDEAACAAVSRELIRLIEVLRADGFYRPCDIKGVDRDCLLVGLALALRKTAYAERLLGDSLERLQALQLEIGLTADGVWRAGTYSDHCALLGSLRILLGDLDEAGVSHLEPIIAAAKKMTLFAEAMLKSDGRPLAIDDGKRKAFAAQLSGAQRLLASASGKNAGPKSATRPRITETYVFRDAQYFVSHTSRSVSPDSSLFVLHAQSPSLADGEPGGLTLALAHGERDLLIRAEPERAGRKDKAARHDPALGNGYHIDGVGFDPDAPAQDQPARLVKSWRGEGWAAAKGLDLISPRAAVTRLMIHFKAAHALLVVDEIAARDGADHDIEQFWHVAPGLAAPPSPGAAMRFDAKEQGGLNVAFDATGEVAVESEGEGFRIRRSARLAKGALASFFQWSAEPAPAEVRFATAEGEGWRVKVAGAGLTGTIVHAGDALSFEPETES
ncbi:MAG TPA: hypothetical protein VHC42_06885 [Rhizomicrobium sp.]|nr:hypothetical protein [Rhizomicrobium sp.]